LPHSAILEILTSVDLRISTKNAFLTLFYFILFYFIGVFFVVFCGWEIAFELNSRGAFERQKPQAPTPQAPVPNRQTRKVANAKVRIG